LLNARVARCCRLNADLVGALRVTRSVDCVFQHVPNLTADSATLPIGKLAQKRECLSIEVELEHNPVIGCVLISL
jgi:hypothetical protein